MQREIGNIWREKGRGRMGEGKGTDGRKGRVKDGEGKGEGRGLGGKDGEEKMYKKYSK